MPLNEMTPDINDDTCQLNFSKDSPIVYGCSSDFSFFSKPEIFVPTLEVVKTIQPFVSKPHSKNLIFSKLLLNFTIDCCI